MNGGFRPIRCCEGEKPNACSFPIVFSPFNSQSFAISCLCPNTPKKGKRKLGSIETIMIPEEEEEIHIYKYDDPHEEEEKEEEEEEEEEDEMMLAGYKECAKEALTWLLNLGYEPGHPLIRSLAAHLTKKQAYLEKLNLENFLIEEALRERKESKGIRGEERENEIEDENSKDFEYFADQIKRNKEIQRALVDAVFRGCDLRYETE